MGMQRRSGSASAWHRTRSSLGGYSHVAPHTRNQKDYHPVHVLPIPRTNITSYIAAVVGANGGTHSIFASVHDGEKMTEQRRAVMRVAAPATVGH